MAIVSRNENSASAALVELLHDSQCSLNLFLRLALPAYNLSKEDNHHIEVKHRHKTNTGQEIDILLHKGSFAIIVECKVEDRRKPYQLLPYRDYWFRKTSQEPYMLWLVKYQQKILGEGNALARTITWNELADAFGEECQHFPDDEKVLVQTFCENLTSAEITIRFGKSSLKETIRKGYQQDHVSRILTSVCEQVEGLTGSVEEVNAIPPGLHVGRKVWINKFEDGRIKRLRLILLPYTDTRNQVGPFGFRGNVRLYDRHAGGDLEYVLSRLPQWGKICADASLEFRRNVPGKWKEQLNPELWFPFNAGSRLNFLFAREQLEEAKKNSKFNWRSEAEAIAVGCERLVTFLHLIDKFE